MCKTAQTFIEVTHIIVSSEEVRRLQAGSGFPRREVNKMETILIIVLVVFVLGGGGWGYRRWRA
jgi:hypothetical protein